MTVFKKSLAVFLSVLMLMPIISVGFSLKAATSGTKPAYIQTNGVNVRQGASTSYNSIEKISYRQVTVIATVGDWLQIKYKNDSKEITGYIFNDSSYVYITDSDPDLDFNSQISNFPESYRSALKELHNKYPNWKFIPDYVNLPFSDAVYYQTLGERKQVQLSYHPISWRSLSKDNYNWTEGTWKDTNGGWTIASREIISYYMDPRNFLNADSIYMFLLQSYGNGTYTKEGLGSIVKGSFLDTDAYKTIILNAGVQSGVSPYVIASKIIQEQGPAGGNALISGNYKGYEGYYNFFNVGASGDTNADVIKNGLEFAKQSGWTTPELSIVGGAKRLNDNYMLKGQDTYYYQDYSVFFTNEDYCFQYAQAVHDAYNKGSKLKSMFGEKYDSTLYFRIPVFDQMPTSAYPLPEKNNKLNNYYINDIVASGLTPSFDRYNFNYSFSVNGNTQITVANQFTSVLDYQKRYALKKGNNKVVLGIKSETGYYNYYTLYITAGTDCTLTVNQKYTGGWVKDGNGWWYSRFDGTYPKNGWDRIDGKWYYFDSRGYMAANQWVKDSKGWCYVGPNGESVTNAWVKDSKGWCYLDSNGRMATNKWVKDS